MVSDYPCYEIYKKKSDAKIIQFEHNTDELREHIFQIVRYGKLVGVKLELPTKIKAHYLFHGHCLRSLRFWHNIGGLNEESVENAHAVWNELMRQFGNVRGARKNSWY